jgi:hypothetical protein
MIAASVPLSHTALLEATYDGAIPAALKRQAAERDAASPLPAIAPPAQAALPAGPLFLAIGKRRWRVRSFEDASRKFLATLERAGGFGVAGGDVRVPTPMIVASGGRVIGHVGHNGRVWAGRPRDWHEDTALLYDSRAPGAALDQRAAGIAP